MSQIDAKKFGRMSKALSGALKGGQAAIEAGDNIGIGPGMGVLKIGRLINIGRTIEEKFSKMRLHGKEKPVNTEISERGLVIHIMESALFKLGSADLEYAAKSTLDLVAMELTDIPNHIRVEGHTDNIPMNTEKYPSNWELSSARATEVVRYMIENHDIPPGKISALGYGEYRPIRYNNTYENRAQNRRVDIVVLTLELTQAEPTSDLYNP